MVNESSYSVDEAFKAYWAGVYDLVDFIVYKGFHPWEDEETNELLKKVETIRELYASFRSHREAFAAQTAQEWRDKQCQK